MYYKLPCDKVVFMSVDSIFESDEMAAESEIRNSKTKMRMEKVNLFYGAHHVLGDVTMNIEECSITAIIGPSGCGKSSLLRIFNRMNDLVPIAKVEGKVYFDEYSIYDKEIDVSSLRSKVGMVFQKPNVFPQNIYNNITIGPRHHGIKNKAELGRIVQESLLQVALWDDLKDELKRPAMELSVERQQRLCIARALAMKPDVILMDESCSALDPDATMKIEELMLELAEKYTIIIVTHSMEQALRVSDWSAFMMIDDNKIGRLVEFAPTIEMFSQPKDKRTEDYITGRFG